MSIDSSFKVKKHFPEIQISQESEDEKLSNKSNLKLKGQTEKTLKQGRINSTKNLHQMKKYDFSYENVLRVKNSRKEQKILKLKKEKKKLEQSLEMLKNGAVSAIIEKDEIIDHLKVSLSQNRKGQTDEENQSASDEVHRLQNLLTYIKELEDDKQYYQIKLQKERNTFETEIYKKEAVIEDLVNQLNSSTEKINSLEKYGQLLHEKIKIVEEDNENLSVMLSRSQETLRVSRSNKQEQDQVCNNSDIIPINLSSSSEYVSNLEEECVENKIKQMKLDHELEMFQLSQFYENQISTLKQIYQRQPSQISKRKFQNHLQYYSIQNQSMNSTNTNPFKDMKGQKLFPQNYSFKSGQMETIYEKEETDRTKKTLKRELLDFKKNIHSQFYNSDESDYRGNFDQISEFSDKFFQYPRRNFKKIKSEASIISDVEGKVEAEKWKNLMWFAVGTLAGGSILALTHKLLKN